MTENWQDRRRLVPDEEAVAAARAEQDERIAHRRRNPLLRLWDVYWRWSTQPEVEYRSHE